MTPQQLVHTIVTAATEVKAIDSQVLDLRKLASFTDYFVIASGRSDRQVQAIADRILEITAAQKEKPIGVEGYESGHWILIDFGAVVAHIFYQETREFYGLEQLWSDAPRLELETGAQEASS